MQNGPINEFLTKDRISSESEGKYRELLDLLPHAVFETDMEGNITFLSKSALIAFGYNQARISEGLSVYDLVIPKDRERLQEILLQTKGGAHPSRNEYTALQLDGNTFPIVIHCAPVLRRGEICGLQGIVIDITERKASEHALRASEERFRAVFSALPYAIAIFDNLGYWAYVNPAMADLLDIPRADLIGHHIAEFLEVDCDSSQASSSPIHEYRRFGETRFARPNGTNIDIEYTAMFDMLPRWHMLIMRDITERKLLEVKIRQSQRLEAVGTLAGGIAHDFRNLLMGISGYAELLQIRLGYEHPQYSTVNDLLTCVDKASKLVSQLLAFTKQQVLVPKPTELNELVAEASGFIERLLGEHIAVEWNIAPDTGIVEVDPGQIEQVIVNLVINARDAMMNGGRLAISTDRQCLEEVDNSTPRMQPGEYAVLSVSDNGIGMSAAVKERIFEPFFTTKSNTDRSGLGLAVAYGIIKQHKGYIGVESEEGVGTIFTVYLPVVDSATSAEEEHSERRHGAGSETILLAEDDDMVCTSVKMALEGLGYRVVCARNGLEAIEKFVGHLSEIDLVILDLVMPKLSGMQVWQQLSSLKPDLRVLFMSGYSAASVHQDFSPPPDAPFLAKPFSIVELTKTIRSMLG